MQIYLRLYFETGTANFYTIDSEHPTLRGLFILQSVNKEVKKITNAGWRTICPVTCTLDGSLSLKTRRLQSDHSDEPLIPDLFRRREQVLRQDHLQLPAGKEGELLRDQHTLETVEKEKYVEKNFYQIYVKYMGRALEEIECRAVQNHYNLFYPKCHDVRTAQPGDQPVQTAARKQRILQ